MKFYREKYKNNFYYIKIVYSKLTTIYMEYFGVYFFKNGLRHNSKNSSYIGKDSYKSFCLNDIRYGYHTDFTKESWRRFVKLKAFL